MKYTYLNPFGLLRATTVEWKLGLSISIFAACKKAGGRLPRHEKSSNHADRGIRILFHDPVPAIRDHAFLDVTRGKADHLGHSLSEGFLATQSERRHGEFTFGKKVRKLHEPRMHGALHGVQTRIMIASVFAEPAGRGRKLVPEMVEINAFAAGDEALHVQTAKAKMQSNGFLRISSHGRTLGNGPSIKANRVTRCGCCAANA